MSDQRIRHLFDQLVAEPSAEFEASLRGRLMAELSTPDRSGAGDPTRQDHHQEGLIMTVTLERPDAPPTARFRKRNRLGITLAAAAAIAALVGTALLVTRDDKPDTVVPGTVPTDSTPTPATTAAPTTVPAPDPITADAISLPTRVAVAAPTALEPKITATDARVFQIKFDGLNLWGTRESGSDLFRIDTATGEVVETLKLPSRTTVDWLQAHEGRLYVTTIAGVVIVNGETKEISEPRADGVGGILGLAFTDDAVWLVRSTYNDTAKTGMNTLERWDTALLTKAISVDVGTFPSGGIVAAGDSIFLATADRGLLRFDDGGNLTATIPDIGYSFILAVAAGSVWVPDYDTGEVIRVDVATNEIVARIRVAGIGAHNIVATDTSVWVTTYAATNINVIDPATNTLTVKTHATPRPLSLALIDDAVWISGGGELNSFVGADS